MRIGQSLGGRYRLDERVASGGMGSVWRGTDSRLNRIVAVKVLHPDLAGDEVFRRRFQVEARAMATLKAPGIVAMYDSGEEIGSSGPVLYLVMEYVAGRTLQEILLVHAPLAPVDTLRIMAETAEALHEAHLAGIIHRDVKPANILIADEDSSAKVIDFGIAHADGGAGLTSTGMVMGTAAYVSPEQLRGRNPSGASDVYALGVVAYECLTGRLPFPVDNPATVMSGDHEPPPLPAQVPAPVAAVVMHALAKDPANRWSSAARFADACRVAVGLAPRPVTARQVDSPDPLLTPATAEPVTTATIRRPRRRRAAVVGVVSAAVVTSIAAGVIWWSDEQAPAAAPNGENTADPRDHASNTVDPQDGIGDPIGPTDEGVQGVPVPDVVLLGEAEALDVLAGAGFSHVEQSYWGAGRQHCPVDEQDPAADKHSPADTMVKLSIEMTDNLDSCTVFGPEDGL